MRGIEFLDSAERFLNQYEQEVFVRGREFCKMHLNFAGRDLSLAYINGGEEMLASQRYKILDGKRRKLIREEAESGK